MKNAFRHKEHSESRHENMPVWQMWTAARRLSNHGTLPGDHRCCERPEVIYEEAYGSRCTLGKSGNSHALGWETRHLGGATAVDL